MMDIEPAEDTGSKKLYSITADVIRDFCYDAMRSGKYPTDEQVDDLVGKYRKDGLTYLPYYEFDFRPNIAFGFEFEPDPDNPDSPIMQQHLSCGHWCSTFCRHCPHCGARIVDMDEVPDYIVEAVLGGATEV